VDDLEHVAGDVPRGWPGHARGAARSHVRFVGQAVGIAFAAYVYAALFDLGRAGREGQGHGGEEEQDGEEGSAHALILKEDGR
jgi:hypothetical protein